MICKIIPDEHMPVDSDGNRAEVIMGSNSTISRANPARMYEHYFNAASRDIHKRLCAMLGLQPFTKEREALKHIQTLARDVVEKAGNYLLGFYAILSPRMRGWFDEGKIEGTMAEYLAAIVRLGIGLYMPTDNAIDLPRTVLTLEQEELGYKPLNGPVSYVDNAGRRVSTHHNVRIGSSYLILLEKIANDWGAVDSGKLQLHGFLSPLTKRDKYSNPTRQQPSRGLGEAENRNIVAYAGTRAAAEQLDRNNNPLTHRAMVNNLLRAAQPTNVPSLVDRKQIPFGNSKPIQLIRHMMRSAGIDFVYFPHNEVPDHYHRATYEDNIEVGDGKEEGDD